MAMAEHRPRALITPAVLVWARESAGLEPDVAASKLQVKQERLASWETGEQSPTFPQLLKLGNVYKRNPAVFYMPEPPAEKVPIRDFRRLPDALASVISPNLRHELRLAAGRREILLDILGLDAPQTRLPQFGLSGVDTEQAAATIRRHLKITLTEQKTWRKPDIAFFHWRQALEASGILVFQTTSIDLTEMRGFSMAEARLPVVLLNGKDSHAGRSFSSIHELCHLILRSGGLCLPGQERDHAEDSDIEVLCNRVAGAVLVPAAVLSDEPVVRRTSGLESWRDDDLAALAREFGCSREVVLRRLLVIGRTTERFYRQKHQQFRAEWDSLQLQEHNFPVPVATKILNRLGRLYARNVLQGFYDGRVSASNLSRYLGMRLKHLPEFEVTAYR